MARGLEYICRAVPLSDFYYTGASRRFLYDSQFRLKLSSNSSLKWSDTDPELIATWLSADATRSKPSCFICGNPDHLASDCPLNAISSMPDVLCPVCNTTGHTACHCPQLTFAKNSPSVLPASNKLEFCRIWNRKGSCFRGPSCRYLHACSDCHGGHPKQSCPKQSC